MLRNIFLILFISFFLSGCITSKSAAPIDNRGQIINKPPTSYKVRKGDSLYMVAMEFDLDYIQLAKWNNIKKPYHIKTGERLRLTPRKYNRKKTTVAKKKKKRRSKKTTPRKKRKNSKVTKNYRKKKSVKKPPTRKKVKPAPRKKKTPVKTVKSDINWRWPANGKIIAKYAKNSDRKGIDIAAKRASSVRAAASGKVVYSGTGLVRYGKLIIIKHKGNYLSAYAHNDKLLVKEGATVKSGAKIARMGDTGTDKVKLHFEIRRNGKPVDPMKYLPKR